MQPESLQQGTHRCHVRAGRSDFTDNITPSGSPITLCEKRINWGGIDEWRWLQTGRDVSTYDCSWKVFIYLCDKILNCADGLFTFRRSLRSWHLNTFLQDQALETISSYTLSSAALVINYKMSAGSRHLWCLFHSFISLSLQSPSSYQISWICLPVQVKPKVCDWCRPWRFPYLSRTGYSIFPVLKCHTAVRQPPQMSEPDHCASPPYLCRTKRSQQKS